MEEKTGEVIESLSPIERDILPLISEKLENVDKIVEKTGKDKTSIVFALSKDRPGGLHDVLLEFAERDINLTKIESRPSKKALGDYLFFLDLEGHRDDNDVMRALNMIEKKVAFYKLLGSYPKAKGG